MAVKRHLGKSSKTLRYCQSNANGALLLCSNAVCVSEELGEDENRSTLPSFRLFPWDAAEAWMSKLPLFQEGRTVVEPAPDWCREGSRIIEMSGEQDAGYLTAEYLSLLVWSCLSVTIALLCAFLSHILALNFETHLARPKGKSVDVFQVCIAAAAGAHGKIVTAQSASRCL